jgi:CubicO group peptidase (beta-lactamase class C family)
MRNGFACLSGCGQSGPMHKPSAGVILFLAFLCWLELSSLEGETDIWEQASAESQGFSRKGLQDMSADLFKRGTTAFLVIRNDKIVLEAYAPGFSRVKPHGTASLAKALVGGTSIMLLLDDGKIKPDDRACKFVPQWKTDPRKSQITIANLATHTSGIEDAELDEVPHNQLTGWKGDFWKRLAPPRDSFTIARDTSPLFWKLRASKSAIATQAWQCSVIV